MNLKKGMQCTKNYKIVKRILSLNEFYKIAQTDKIVYVSNWGKIHNTSFFLCWQLTLVHSWISKGLFYKVVRNEK